MIERIRRTEDWLCIIEGSIFNFLRFTRAPDIELSVVYNGTLMEYIKLIARRIRGKKINMLIAN